MLEHIISNPYSELYVDEAVRTDVAMLENIVRNP